jgi:hypothetical protein
MGSQESIGSVCKGSANLSNCSSRGLFFKDAKFLHISAEQVDVPMLNNFWLEELTSRYDHITPHLQEILKAVIGKDGKECKPGSLFFFFGSTFYIATVNNTCTTH